jgi:hypothetical protein
MSYFAVSGDAETCSALAAGIGSARPRDPVGSKRSQLVAGGEPACVLSATEAYACAIGHREGARRSAERGFGL